MPSNVVLPREVAERIQQVLRDVREADDLVTLLAVQSDAGIVTARMDTCHQLSAN